MGELFKNPHLRSETLRLLALNDVQEGVKGLGADLRVLLLRLGNQLEHAPETCAHYLWHLLHHLPLRCFFALIGVGVLGLVAHFPGLAVATAVHNFAQFACGHAEQATCVPRVGRSWGLFPNPRSPRFRFGFENRRADRGKYAESRGISLEPDKVVQQAVVGVTFGLSRRFAAIVRCICTETSVKGCEFC